MDSKKEFPYPIIIREETKSLPADFTSNGLHIDSTTICRNDDETLRKLFSGDTKIKIKVQNQTVIEHNIDLLSILSSYLLNNITYQSKNKVCHSLANTITFISGSTPSVNNSGETLTFLSGDYDFDTVLDKIYDLKKKGEQLVTSSKSSFTFTQLSDFYIEIMSSRNNFIGSSLAKNKTNVKLLKESYDNCSNVLYTPITWSYLQNHDLSVPNLETLYGHANGLLFNKVKKTFTRIEPEIGNFNEGEVERLYKMQDTAIIDFVKKNIDPELKFEPINETCPQSFTGDLNCLFWTLYITYVISTNLDKDPNELIKEISQDIENLPHIIDNFKLKLIKYEIPLCLIAYGKVLSIDPKTNKLLPYTVEYDTKFSYLYNKYKTVNAESIRGGKTRKRGGMLKFTKKFGEQPEVPKFKTVYNASVSEVPKFTNRKTVSDLTEDQKKTLAAHTEAEKKEQAFKRGGRKTRRKPRKIKNISFS